MGTVQLLMLFLCVYDVTSLSIGEIDLPTKEIANTVNQTLNLDNVTLSSTYKNLENQLYDLIVARKQDEAVTKAISMYGRGYGHIIRDVADRLVNDGKPEVFDFAYKLVAANARYIPRTCFPWELRIGEDFVIVKIINHQYGYALKYGQGQDWAGDRTAYGDPSTRTRFEIMWKFWPMWSGDRVYFVVRPVNLVMFLKLGNSRDKDGDHGAYGSDNRDTDRHLWYLKPVKHDGKLMFYIINKEYDEPLKLGQSTDSDGDRYAYGHSRLDFNPDKFAWELDVQ